MVDDMKIGMKISVRSVQVDSDVGKMRVSFSPPIEFEVTEENGALWVDDYRTDIVEFASTIDGLRKMVRKSLAEVYEDYALAPDEILARDALELKKFLLERSGKLEKEGEISGE
jgi:hypothetical protein